MVLGPDEKYLNKSLPSLQRVCNIVCVVFNNTDIETKQEIASKGFITIEDDREWGKYQPLIKERALEQLKPFNPDFILALDADEEFMGTREDLETLASQNDAWYLFIVNHINDELHFTREWSFPNCRFFKYQNLVFDRRPVHCGSAPLWAFQIGNYTPLIIRHYGLMEKSARIKKAERYDKYDPEAKHKGKAYYDFLRSDVTGELYNEQILKEELKKDLEKYKQKRKTMSRLMEERHIRLLRKKDGIEVVIPEKYKETTLKTGNFEYLGIYGICKPEADVLITEEAPINLVCDCGFQAKTETSLKTHKTRKHGNTA